MQIKQKLKAFVSLVCVFALIFSICRFPVAAADANSVTATTSATVKQGSSAYCYVYIDSTEGLASLDVSVHYDPAKVKITNVYNSVSCTLYDGVINTDNVQFSYILDGEGTTSQTRLFYFVYQVLSGAEVGDAYFDITIGEAYDNSLNDISVSGSRCNFEITETVTNKSCSISGSSTVSTSVEKEFSLSYRFSTYQIASGSAVISYDSELFEVVEATNGGFLSNKVADINTELAGSVYISFVGTEYNTKYDFVTVKFKTLKNVAETSNISLKITELYDIDLNAISCSGCTTAAQIVFDDTYVGGAPKMQINAEYNTDTNQVVAVINLEENSRLGAGDFVITFDSEALTLSNYEKGFSPNFFNINDKQVSEGIFKFSIISLEDIIQAQTILTIAFDVLPNCSTQSTVFDISGSLISDSLTNAISLNLVDGSISIPPIHVYESKITAPTCAAEGYTTYTCSVCGNSYIGDFSATTDDHTYVEGAVTMPTVTTQGFTLFTCSVCGDSYKDNIVEATGDTVQNMQIVATDTDITVTWEAIEGTTQYNLYVYNSALERLILRPLAATTTSVTLSWPEELEWGETYMIGIKPCTTRWLTTNYMYSALQLGNRIVDVSVESEGRGLRVNWQAYDGAEVYYVFVYKRGEFDAGAVARATAYTNTARIVTGIDAETDYEVRVAATGTGLSQKMADAMAIDARLAAYAPAPDKFAERGITPTKVAFSWEEIKGADYYWAYLTPVDGGETIIKEARQAVTSVWGLTPNTTYEVQILARVIDADGVEHFSGRSEVLATVTTSDWEDIGFTAEITGSQAEFTWTVPTNAYGYYIYGSANGGATYKRIAYITDPNTTSYTYTRHKDGYTYAIGMQVQDDLITTTSDPIEAIVK